MGTGPRYGTQEPVPACCVVPVRDVICFGSKFQSGTVSSSLGDMSFKGGPEPLEKEIHKILGSKREDRFSDPFFD